MGYLISFLLMMVGALFHIKNKTWVNPASFMCYFWSIVTFSAALRLFGLNDVSLIVWMLILVGVLAFSFGTVFNITINGKKEYILKKSHSTNSFLTPFSFWILFVVLSIFIIISLKTTIELMNMGYRLDVIRQATLGAQIIDGYVFDDSTFAYYFRYIQSALQIILTATGIEIFVDKPKKNIKYLLAVLFITIADSFSNGGRWVIMYSAIEFLICYLIIKNRKNDMIKFNISKKGRRYLILAVVALVVVMIRITSLRLGGGFFQHYYVYLCGCVQFLDSKLKFLNANDYYLNLFCGQYGIWSFIFPYVRQVTGNYPQMYIDAMDIVGNTQVFEYIGQNQTYNAFVSAFYYLYADLRWVGVIVGMFLFGMVAGTVFKKAYYCFSDDKVSMVAPYLMVSQMILKSIQTYPLAANSYVTAIVIMILIFFIRNNACIKSHSKM